MRLRQKLVDAADTVKGFFGAKKQQDSAVQKLEAIRVSTDYIACLLRCSCRMTYMLCAFLPPHATAKLVFITHEYGLFAVWQKFGIHSPVNERLESWRRLQARTEEARALFRDATASQFVIVTIPTVMAVAESARLAEALREEDVPVRSIIINQASRILHLSSDACR